MEADGGSEGACFCACGFVDGLRLIEIFDEGFDEFEPEGADKSTFAFVLRVS